jgi:hypothetical protein
MQVPQIQQEMLSDEDLINEVDELIQANPGCRILMFNHSWLEAIPADKFDSVINSFSDSVSLGLVKEII